MRGTRAQKLCFISNTFKLFFFFNFLMLHPMWTFQKGFRITLHQVCRSSLECKKIIRKSYPPPFETQVKTFSKTTLKSGHFFPQRNKEYVTTYSFFVFHICDKICIKNGFSNSNQTQTHFGLILSKYICNMIDFCPCNFELAYKIHVSWDSWW